MNEDSRDPEFLLERTNWIHRLAQRLVEDPDQAADVAQEASLQAWQRPPSADRPPGPWLQSVVRNAWRTLRRSERRRSHHEQLVPRTSSSPSAHEVVERGELQRRVVEAVMSLPEPERTIVLLRYFEGWTSAAIARREGLPAGTVRWRLREALARLRRKLEGAPLALLLVPLPRPARPGAITVPRLAVAAAIGAALILGGPWLPWWKPPSSGDHGSSSASLAGRDRETSHARIDRSGGSAATITPERRAVAPPERTEAGGTVAIPPSQRVRLQDSTGAALPSFLLRSAEEGQQVEVWSDADGEVFLPAMRAWRPADHPQLAEQFDHDLTIDAACRDPAGRILCTVAAGPTFGLALELATGAPRDRLEAVLLPPTFGGELHTPRNCSAPLRLDGERCWVRFGALLEQGLQLAGSPLTLAVRDREGLWFGGHVLAAPRDREGEVLPIRVSPTCRLLGALVASDGAPVREGQLRLRPSADLPRGRRTIALADGAHFDVGWLEPGEYVLEAWSNRHALTRQSLRLPIGVFEHTVELDPREATGVVHGAVTSRSGRRHEETQIRLFTADAGIEHRVFYAPVEWTRAGDEWRGAYLFEGVPAGRYHIETRSFFHYAWEPEEATVEGSGRVDFVCQDDRPHADLAFEVFDAAGQPVGRFGLRYVLWNDRTFHYGTRETGVPWIKAIPLERHLDCFVYVPGHAVWCGALEEFSPHPEDPGVRVAEVHLQRGWGALFRVEDAQGEPVVGAELFLDDVTAGLTGVRGTRAISWTGRPRTVAVRFRGRRLAGTSRVGEATEFEVQNHVVRLRLAPPAD